MNRFCGTSTFRVKSVQSVFRVKSVQSVFRVKSIFRYFEVPTSFIFRWAADWVRIVFRIFGQEGFRVKTLFRFSGFGVVTLSGSLRVFVWGVLVQ